ncbi:MAG: amidohydrolase family protein [Opitutales bacterium]
MATPLRIDSHQHFWHYNPAEHVWMTEQMGVLQQDYLPQHLEPLLNQIGFDACIAVQARQSLEETRWLLELSDRHDMIRGVVGWVDLRSPDLREQLERFAAHPKLVGVRHVVHDEPDDQFMLGEAFRRGIAALRHYELSYDLLLFPKHLPVAVQLVEEFPEQRFVLDHIAKPDIAGQRLSPWKEELFELAKFPQVACKLSGMVTEAKSKAWQAEDFSRYLDCVLEAFGPERVMIGSDWPVCTLSGEYSSTMGLVIDYVQQFAPEIRAHILGGNCARIYQLKGID